MKYTTPTLTKNTNAKIVLNSLKLLNLFLISFLLIGFTSCSSSGSGKGDSSLDSLTDEELRLGDEQRFGGGSIPIASSRDSGPFSDVHFAYDSSVVDNRYFEMLRESAAQLKNDPNLKAEIEGHCDVRGTQEYNLALGEERAKSVLRILSQYGANDKQMSIISYGSEIPLDPSNNEAAYAKNRRVHFAIYKEKR